jgi:hypothetical protein
VNDKEVLKKGRMMEGGIYSVVGLMEKGRVG